MDSLHFPPMEKFFSKVLPSSLHFIHHSRKKKCRMKSKGVQWREVGSPH